MVCSQFISNTKFLGLVIRNFLSWKDHITQLTPKLCTFDFKRGQLETLLGQDQEIPVEDCLKNLGYYH